MENKYENINLELLRDHLSECTVLLKKDGNFPLENPGNIAAYGNGVRKTIKGGTGSGEVNSRFMINIEDGLKKCGFKIINDKWLDEYEDIYLKAKEDFRKEIKQLARKQHTLTVLAGMGAVMPEPEYELDLDYGAQACIYVLSRISGEGSDRRYIKGDIELTDTEIRDINLLNEQYEKFMLVINAGGPVDLDPVKDVKNILILSQLGVETGYVLGQILLGESPTGKLTTTWAGKDQYCQEIDFGDPHETRYREGIYVGYRYFTSFGIKPLYPFGYGLTYSEFRIDDVDVIVRDKVVNVSAEVMNIGEYEAKEVVQAYISKPAVRLDEPKLELASFVKSSRLKPGEKENVTMNFELTDLASYDEEREVYFLEKGKYGIYVGNSSEDLEIVKVIELSDEAIISKVRNAFRKPDFIDLKTEKTEREYEGIDIIRIDAADFETVSVEYDKDIEISDAAKKLSDEELMYLSMGSFNPSGGLISMIGNASTSVAGAAGESTLVLKDKGIDNLIMSDGPAGIRISRDYYRDEKAVHSLGAAIPESVMEYMPKWQQKLLSLFNRKPKNIVVEHQYATAIPIGTAIAQSFNVELAQMCGDIVGKEMEVFNIDLWLAPALNIHRDIRCGRNFEYFSEDPLLSGKMASAMTKGVQSHKGKGVTIKHFCCNNQETNRTANNSIVSERTIRQIYLKGFEICIQEAHPAALMSSYNLINGEHTSEKKELISDILYDEFDYDGLVMTDWVINHGSFAKNNKYDGAYSYKVVMSGNSMFMPGSRKDFEELKKGFADGVVSRKQLEENATRILRVIDRLKKKEG